ncbi:MAG: hypothetical protein IVW57_07215 [Ktedonobacterales bacterium]|nr:hypothetical protein [Ktedonobacterales bacterium]
MSESNETSAAVASMATRSRRGWQVLLGHPRMARTLATAGAALFAFAAWAPWWVYIATTPARAVAYSLDPGRDPALSPLDVFFGPSSLLVAWSAVSVLGVLLAALLWQRRGALTTRLALLAFGAWAALCSWISLAFLLTAINGRLTAQPPLPTDRLSRASVLQAHGPAYGLWLAALALALTWVGAILLARVELRGHGATRLVAPSARLGPNERLPRGTGWLTAAVIFWAVGFLVMPWGAVNCDALPLIYGTCTGVSGSAALQVALENLTTSVDPLAAHSAVALLLAGGGALVLASLWLRVAAAAQRVWSALWLLAALGIALLTYTGIAAITTRASDFGLPTGTWRGEGGLWVTFLALPLGIVGLGVLEVSTRRRPRPASSPA